MTMTLKTVAYPTSTFDNAKNDSGNIFARTSLKSKGNTAIRQRTKYQHKVCFKFGCPKKSTYGCMHCTCDGRCGLGHESGQCGDYREGSREQCAVEGCTKDERCTHSRRAVCYTCRRHRVSGKRLLVDREQVPKLVKLQKSQSLNSTFQALPGIGTLGQIGYKEDRCSLKNLWIKVQGSSSKDLGIF